ncbi:MAG: hypothetical protein ABI311_06485 [Gemmatimonadaceae bacterium]
MIGYNAKGATRDPAAFFSADNKVGGTSSSNAHAAIEQVSRPGTPVFKPTEEWAREPLSAGELELLELAVREATGGDLRAGRYRQR